MSWTERLGPLWTREEVSTFFRLFKELQPLDSTSEATISEQLSGRTPDMVRALVQMHKGFLSLPMATDEGLYAILTDHYNAQLEWEREAKKVAGIERKMARKAPQKQIRSMQWKKFIAAIDEAFFEHSEFLDCLEQLGMKHVQKAKRSEWSVIRMSMGHPRRFSKTFLNEERQKLHRYRNVVRYAQRTKEFPTDIRFPYKIFKPLAIGTHVQVLHPNKNTNEICNGRVCSVLSADHSYEVIVKYSDRKEILNCPDTSVMVAHTEKPGLLYWQQHQEQETKSSPPTPKPVAARSIYPLHEEIPHEATIASSDTEGIKQIFTTMRAVTALLQRKEMLVGALAKMNDQAVALLSDYQTELAAQGNINSRSAAASALAQFQSQYAWVIVNLDTTNDMLAAALHRLQSIKHAEDTLLMETNGVESTLNPDQIRWAHQFLTVSREKSQDLVTDTIKRLSSDERVQTVPDSTKNVIMGCMDLVLTLQAASTSKEDLAPIVLHKLLDRNLEQIIPKSQANMGLYHEICQSVEVLKSVLMHPSQS
ncbi:hypothetical protein THRCLA_11776 [Thraustotheca clavata]|uniref:DIRP domain-containing protein n=1 Tax=Thraustotheca clavata TaxID=74557 RepID=A0A1V9Y6R5_9STRA|nr:hypothetical protein THRCLA_11776 [Thraustotheca clavata]